MATPSRTQSIPPPEQLEALLDNQREANQDEPRNFKDDALTDKRVEVEPDGTGPTSTGTFDAPEDRARDSGNAVSGIKKKDPKPKGPKPKRKRR